MPAKRDILELLKRDELLELVDRFGVEVPDRRAREGLVDALAASRRATLVSILESLPRDTLKKLCFNLDLDDSGREKALLIKRLLGAEGGAAVRHGGGEITVTVPDLRGQRGDQGWSQSELASRVGVSQTMISMWETGRLQPRPDDLRRLEEIFAASAGEKQVAVPPPAAIPNEAEPRPRRGRPPGGRSRAGDDQPKPELGYEAQLWRMADALRGGMDAAEYKHVVLGLIFLKYISDAFEEQHARLVAEQTAGADPEDPDEYRAQNVFWVPPEARWAQLKAQAPQPTIGQLVDQAMAGIERDNPALKGVLPKDYARPALDKTRLGQLINLVSNIKVGDEESRAKDVLGRVYEYFLSQFASAEGKKGGEFYTPRCVVKLLVEMLEPYRGRVYDPCCGSSGMFVQSVEFIRAHARGTGNGGRMRADISVYGQESNYTTWRLAKMNLAIRGIDGQIAHGDTFHNDRHADLKADFILANPPFNVSDWGGDRLRDDKRWKYGVPPAGNANFAWVQHIVHHLAPTGVAGFVLANGSMSSNQSGEGEIRKSLIEADLVDCMVALPGQLFYSTQIPACLWFLARDRRNGKFRDRHGHVLFIDARKLGRMIDRTHRELTDDDIARIAATYHAWRSRAEASAKPGATLYADVPGFCKSAMLGEVRKHGHVLTPGRYVGAEAAEDDGEPFPDKMKRLVAQLRQQQAEAVKLDAAIAASLRELGYGI